MIITMSMNLMIQPVLKHLKDLLQTFPKNIQCLIFNYKKLDHNSDKYMIKDKSLQENMLENIKYLNHLFHQIFKDQYQRKVLYLQTEDFGLDQPLLLKETVCSTFILIISIQEQFIQCSSSLCYTDGGVIQLMECINQDTIAMMKYQKICTINQIFVFLQLQNSGSDQDDKYKQIKIEYSYLFFNNQNQDKFLFVNEYLILKSAFLQLMFECATYFFSQKACLFLVYYQSVEYQQLIKQEHYQILILLQKKNLKRKIESIQHIHHFASIIIYFNTNSKMKKNLFLIIQDSNQSYSKINHAQTSKNIWSGSENSTKYRSRSKTPKSSKSPNCFKSPKYRGIMQKNIQERLAYYVKLNKLQKAQCLNSKCFKENQQAAQCKEKPEINQISKQLYKKIRQQRSLSPNVFERFKKYQYQRAQREAKNQFYHNEVCNEQRVKPQKISKENHLIKTIQKINSNTNREFGKIFRRQLLPKDTNQKLQKTFKKNNNNK